MSLTPNDIRNYEFRGQMRGYDKDAVDEFQEEVAATLETVLQEKLKLSMEVDSIKSQLAGLKQFEDSIKGAAIDARRNADMTVANAKQEAELILNRAKAEADKAVEARSKKIIEIESQVSQLDLAKRSYLSKLKGLISSHLELVEEISRSELSNEAEEMLDITDSSEVKTRKRETLGSPASRSKPIKTEESHAPGKIVSAAPQSQTDKNDSDTTPSPIEHSSDKEEPIDAELVQALEDYTGKQSGESKDAVSKDQPPVGEAFVETTARAEDIPEGFVAKDADEVGSSTDKIIRPPKTSEPLPERHPISPEEFEKSIDDVAAKFEEEIEKAEKS